MEIRPLQKSDYDQWLPLWQENCLHQIDDTVTHETWGRLCDKRSEVNGLGAFDQNTLLGILHYVIHPTTGSITPACYMQDLYIGENYRRQGLARALVWELGEMGKAAKWSRIYWLAEENNTAAQNLYKTLGVKLNFTLHLLPV